MTVLAVLLGMFGGMVVMMGLHFACMPFYPPPEGLNVMDPAQEAQLHEWMKTLPDGAFALAGLCHWLGAASGAAIAMLITGRKSLLPAIIIGALFTVAGAANIFSVPHPSWFPYVDIPGYLILALVAGKLLLRRSDPEAAAEK